MREFKRTSSLPFEINYSGEHPAALWLMTQLQQRYVKVNLMQKSECWSVSDVNVSYGVSQPFYSVLGEKPLYWPFEWCTQMIDGKVKYALSELQVVLSESECFQASFLDLHGMTTELIQKLKSAPTHFLPKETQPLSIVWKMNDSSVESSETWCVQGVLSVDLIPSGLLWECSAKNSRWFLRYVDGQCGFSGEVRAYSKQEALNTAKNELPIFFFGFDKCKIQKKMDKIVLDVSPLETFWPKITQIENTLTIVIPQPDGTELSWLREGYCWWLMKQLLYFLDSRHSSPEQVFTRLQHLEQKMRHVLTPFLRKHRFF